MKTEKRGKGRDKIGEEKVESSSDARAKEVHCTGDDDDDDDFAAYLIFL